MDAGTFYYTTQVRDSSDDLEVGKGILLINTINLFSDLKEYMDSYEAVLPKEAFKVLGNFFKKLKIKDFTTIKYEEISDKQSIHSHIQYTLTSLAAFQSEFSYVIADTQVTAMRITERAFEHLKRSIVVDEDIRKKWIDAFNDKQKRELNCEKLGALHLLSHGIWAFKAHGAGGRTDLIMDEPLSESDISIVKKTSIALVLTEWKVVKGKKDYDRKKDRDRKIKEAKNQAQKYSVGVLRGLNLPITAIW